VAHVEQQDQKFRLRDALVKELGSADFRRMQQ